MSEERENLEEESEEEKRMNGERLKVERESGGGRVG